MSSSESKEKTLVMSDQDTLTRTLKSAPRPAPQTTSEFAPTLPVDSASGSQPRPVDPTPAPLSTADRYTLRHVIGEGGMGEVRLYTDRWVGRDVAMKVMRSSAGSLGEQRARFLREARVQGQLEHPSVVPVYDIALGADGEVSFTMKRIKGVTLREVIDRLREGDAETAEQFTLRKLLSALSSVCLAVAFAHRRGVVHRDLKPENVMLGDFGEVYVLDWGVARIQGSDDLPPLDDGADGEIAQTQAGALLGTPGYMAPEQARGETDAISPACDVYALGALLFELLTLQRMHRAHAIEAMLVSTVQLDGGRPAEAVPERDVPPELDEICQRATRLDPSLRFGSARELADALEGYLDGQRDAERRRELAAAHIGRARAALESAGRGGPNAEKDRARGMRELGQALALDPTDGAALETLMELVTAKSDELPPEAEAELKQVEFVDRARNARVAGYGYLSLVSITPILLWLGIRNFVMAAIIDGLVVLLAGFLFWMAKPERMVPRCTRPMMVLNFTLVGSLSLFLGPYVIVPAAAATMAAVLMVALRANKGTRQLILTLSALSVFVPLVLQWTGVLPPSYVFNGNSIEILPLATELPAVASQAFLIGSTVLQLALTGWLMGNATKVLLKAERRNFAQAWRTGSYYRRAAPRTEPIRAFGARGHGHTVNKSAPGAGMGLFTGSSELNTRRRR